MDTTTIRRSHRLMSYLFVLALSLIVFGSLIQAKQRVAREQKQTVKYDYNWESLKKHPVPKWFDDSKFGVFIHWGPWSVVEAPPWYIYSNPEKYYPLMKERFGASPPEFGLKDAIKLFKAEKWDPQQWSELFEQAGAKYVVLIGEHHDGYMLGDSDLTPWCATKIGPKRDLVKDLAAAVRSKGMKFAPSYHRERHAGMFSKTKFVHSSPPMPDVAEEIRRMPEAESLYGPFEYSDAFIEDYVARWKEMEQKYQPDFMWVDDCPFFYVDKNHPQVETYENAFMRMIADYYNVANEWGKEVYINNKGKPGRLNFPAGVGCGEHDRIQINEIRETKWQCPMTMGGAWYYSTKEDKSDSYKSSTKLIHLLCDVVSKNGNFLLNIGPRPDGTIPDGQRNRLLAIGDWLTVNGEAIYGTRPWFGTQQNKGDIRFTTKGQTLYAFLLEEQDALVIQSTDTWDLSSVVDVTLLGADAEIEWKHIDGGIEITPLADAPVEHTWTYKIVTET